MGLNLNKPADGAEQAKAEAAAKENAAATQTAASGEAAAGLEKAIESADSANPLTPTIDGNDAPNNAGGIDPIRAVVESEDLEGNTRVVEVDGSTPVGDDVLATYSSSPINNLSVGRHQFENGILSFKRGDEEDLEEFEKILNDKNFPIQERVKIVKIDIGAAERLIADARASQGGATQAIDSTVGERATKPKAEGNLGSTAGRGN